MALRLVGGGYRLFGFSRSARPDDLSEKGIEPLESAAAVAASSDVIITMLPDTPDVEAVLLGVDGVSKGLGSGKLVIDMSSISPSATKEFARQIAAMGCAYLDAPVSGGEIGATNGTLSIMVGGAEEDFERALPLFRLMGSNVSHVGPVGSGQVTKIANQIIVALTIEAVSEALVFTARAGVDVAKARQALMQGFAGSRVLEVHGRRMIERTFDPGFRIELHQKDLSLALQAAREMHLSLPNTAATQEIFNSCAAAGDSRLDHSGLVKAIERMAHFEIPAG